MEYADDVIAHLQRCSDVVARSAGETFNQGTWCEFSDLSISSPIEQLLYTSLKTISVVCFVEPHRVERVNGVDVVSGLDIRPQMVLGKYRVDFYIAWYGSRLHPNPPAKAVVVECDSQQWHERTEKERRYEKHRDRVLASSGLHTLRFTGKEIKENALKTACEIIAFVTAYKADDMYESFLDEEAAHGTH